MRTLLNIIALWSVLSLLLAPLVGKFLKRNGSDQCATSE